MDKLKSLLKKYRFLIVILVIATLKIGYSAYKKTEDFSNKNIDESFIFLTFNGAFDNSGKKINTRDSFIEALESGKLSEKTVKDYKTFLVNTSNKKDIVESLINQTVKSDGFRKVYSKLTYKEAEQRLKIKGYNSKAIKAILNNYTKSGGKLKQE